MGDEQRKVLEMLSEGKISVQEAEHLLRALKDPGFNPKLETSNVAQPKYLRVEVQPQEGAKGDRVNIRVPLQLLRAGAKMTALIPKGAHGKVNRALSDKGIEFDVSQIKPENIDALIDQLTDFSVDVDGDEERVRIFCE